MRERWRSAPGFPAYQVSDRGRVRRWVPAKGGTVGHVLKIRLNRKGYVHYALVHPDEIRREVMGHRLVLQAFVGGPPVGTECNHINGDKSDNRLVNLEWVTPIENMRHSYRLGRNKAKGERVNTAKLTAIQVREIRSKAGRQIDLANEYGVSRSLIGAIQRREVWSHVA